MRKAPMRNARASMEKAEREFLLRHLAAQPRTAAGGSGRAEQGAAALSSRRGPLVGGRLRGARVHRRASAYSTRFRRWSSTPPQTRDRSSGRMPDDTVLSRVPGRSTRCMCSAGSPSARGVGRISRSCCGSLKPPASAACASPPSPKPICAAISSRIPAWANWIATSGSCSGGALRSGMRGRRRK